VFEDIDRFTARTGTGVPVPASPFTETPHHGQLPRRVADGQTIPSDNGLAKRTFKRPANAKPRVELLGRHSVAAREFAQGEVLTLVLNRDRAQGSLAGPMTSHDLIDRPASP
jgi:hypothetical protein